MAKVLISDDLWEVIEPLLPRIEASAKGGRPPIGNREALTGILFVLETGIPWEDLPQEMGCVCGRTCWRRLRDWQIAGVWRHLHERLLERLNGAGGIDWIRAVVDSSSIRAVCGGQKPVRIPPIVRGRGRNIISSRTLPAFRLRPRSRRRLLTMSRS
jgi:transposase